jgi:hypothetical protein
MALVGILFGRLTVTRTGSALSSGERFLNFLGGALDICRLITFQIVILRLS